MVGLPEQNPISGKFSGINVRVSFECYEADRESLTYKLHRELVWVAHVLLNDDSPIGIMGCKVVTPLEDQDDPTDENNKAEKG